MPAEVLERVRSEIEDRLAVLSGAVAEAQQLEIALVALGEVPVASRPAPDDGNGRRRRKAAGPRRRLHGRKGRRRKGSTPGANDQTVLDSLHGLTEPLDIKTVAGKTGLSQQTASYTLKKLTGKGLLTQSSVAGGRGMPKLVFALASNGPVLRLEPPRTRPQARRGPRPRFRRYRNAKLGRKPDAGARLQGPHRQTEEEFLGRLLYPLSHGDRRTSRWRIARGLDGRRFRTNDSGARRRSEPVRPPRGQGRQDRHVLGP